MSKDRTCPHDAWTREETRILDGARTPPAVQELLDSLTYSSDSFYRAPRRALADRRAHCFDGALLAVAALRRQGHRPLILDLRAHRDDDHILAIFRRGRHIGAVAKSNFVGLRYREPIFRNLRELALSYFESYYNLDGEKSLRAYSTPVDLNAFDSEGWMFRPDCLERISDRLDTARHHPIITRAMTRQLAPVDSRTFRSGMIGSVREGIYKPPAKTGR